MKYVTVKKNILNDHFIKFHIDSPNQNHVNADNFIFSGWIFSTNGDDVNLEIESLNNKHQESLNIFREDVVSHFKKNSDELTPPLKCGFKLNLQEHTIVRFYRGETVVAEITFPVIDTAIESEWDVLDKLNIAHLSDDPTILSEHELSILNNSSYKYVGNFISELAQVAWLSTEIKDNLQLFIEDAASLEFGPKIVDSALTNGKIAIKSPLHANTFAYCDCSFYKAPFNYLQFTSNGIVFYIIQHFSFCDAIYIPKLGVHHFLSIWIDKDNYFKHVERITLTTEKKNGAFNSVFVAHNRPYHYNYDMALGLHLLECKKLLEKTPLIALNEEKCFFQPSKLINSKINEVILSDQEFSNYLNLPGFSILAGHQNFNAAKESVYCELFADLDSQLRRNSDLIIKSNIVSNVCDSLQQCGVKLWFGITSQKRKLINQEQEIARTINIFTDLFDSVGVVIDGWTSPLKKTENDSTQIENDLHVAKAIEKLVIGGNVSFYSTIGLTTEEKLVVTSHIDVFLANHGAGSMHVDRMGNRFGVTHNSNVWSAADFVHIHNNSNAISQDDISDFEPMGKAQDYVDYTVAPKVMAREMLKQYFNSINYKKDVR